VQALVFGTTPDPPAKLERADGADDNPLLRALRKTPTNLIEIDEPRPLLPDWVVAKTRLCGICGSDSKQIMLDFGESRGDNPMLDLISLPQVLGHEVVATIETLGPEAQGLEPGDRVVLNPWLSCVTRGVSPICPACEVGDLSQCWSFAEGPIAPGIHTGLSKDVTGGFAERLPAHSSMWFKVPEGIGDELAVLADPFAVSLHGITRNPPPEGGKVLVYGAGALGTTAIAILGALYPEVEVMAVARFEAQAQLARSLGAEVVGHDPRLVMETAAKWSGAVLRGTTGNGTPMAFPGGIDVVYDTIGKPESLEVGVGLLKARGRLVKLGVHGSAAWEAFPLYFKEISLVGSNAFGIEEVGGVRKHGILHYFDMVGSGQIDLAGMLTHTFRLEQWRDAFTTLATQARTGAIKVAFDFRA
jgi:threonine dehydrogenase-like Zn-dependent dehydrogenase